MPSELFKPIGQRPQMISRFDYQTNIPLSQQVENQKETGVQGTKSQVVHRVTAQPQTLFTKETEVDQYRGIMVGRGLQETATPEQLSSLPNRVQAYQPAIETDARFGRLSSAEQAALGLQQTQSTSPGKQSAGEVTSSLKSGQQSDESSESETRQAAPDESKPSGEPLSDEELREVEQLEKRDREVRAHEQAHVSAGGQHIRGGIKYDYTQGPNGKRYVSGGEVQIDLSPESTPEATISKMQQVRRAALAPAQPSAVCPSRR